MFFGIAKYFIDPVLQAPCLGCMIMCLTAAIMGVFVVLKKQSLAGETISHACYPGVIFALLFEKLFEIENYDMSSVFFILIGAFISSFFGMLIVEFFHRRAKISEDSSLSCVLVAFFGIAITIISALQIPFPTLYKELQGYLFGQAATMTSSHLFAYGIVAFSFLVVLFSYYRPIKLVIFDPQFAQAVGVNKISIDTLIQALFVISCVMGIRAVGVVLMSAMLIFPPSCARLWTNRLWVLLLLSGFIGIASGFFGVFVSHETSVYFMEHASAKSRFSIPTGPMIVMIASMFFLFSIFFAPRQGLFFRLIRKTSFQINCQRENILKTIWKVCSDANTSKVSRQKIAEYFQMRPFVFNFLLSSMQKKGWIKLVDNQEIQMTSFGMLWARKIVRLHRLWEVYLVEYCGVAQDRVHPSAEQMEHIITKDIEDQLNTLLNSPTLDPHMQPIPQDMEILLLHNTIEKKNR